NQAVLYALDFRLDLQTARDRVQDNRRQVDIAENGMLPDLNLRANLSTNGTGSGPFNNPTFSSEGSNFTGGLFFNAPLDRVDEAVALRQSQVILAQSERVLMRTLDEAALQVRQAIRDIDRAQFSLLLSERNVEIAENLLEKIDVAPDRASARDRIDGVADLRDAEDSRDDAKRNLQVAILQYLRFAGLLRVTPEGDLQPLPNMPVGEVIGTPMNE
ncbi:MAG: TolC family protein, partial [Phycisphaerales bacterium]|nr:TolC family protein [Phycisphaerales bacterium]